MRQTGKQEYAANGKWQTANAAGLPSPAPAAPSFLFPHSPAPPTSALPDAAFCGLRIDANAQLPRQLPHAPRQRQQQQSGNSAKIYFISFNMLSTAAQWSKSSRKRVVFDEHASTPLKSSQVSQTQFLYAPQQLNLASMRLRVSTIRKSNLMRIERSVWKLF